MSNHKQESWYNVVYRGTGEPGSNVNGMITWTSFPDKDAYISQSKKYPSKDLVIAEGVTKEQAIELKKSTPFAAYLDYAVDQATGSDGSFNPNIFQFCINNFLYTHFGMLIDSDEV